MIVPHPPPRGGGGPGGCVSVLLCHMFPSHIHPVFLESFFTYVGRDVGTDFSQDVLSVEQPDPDGHQNGF